MTRPDRQFIFFRCFYPSDLFKSHGLLGSLRTPVVQKVLKDNVYKKKTFFPKKTFPLLELPKIF